MKKGGSQKKLPSKSPALRKPRSSALDCRQTSRATWGPKPSKVEYA